MINDIVNVYAVFFYYVNFAVKSIVKESYAQGLEFKKNSITTKVGTSEDNSAVPSFFNDDYFYTSCALVHNSFISNISYIVDE